MAILLGDFVSERDVFEQFGEEPSDDIDLLLAEYSQMDYEGSAFVLFLKDDKLYEVNGSHCSCYGLEDQWRPEETTIEALKHRLENGHISCHYGYAKADEQFKVAMNGILNMVPILFAK